MGARARSGVSGISPCPAAVEVEGKTVAAVEVELLSDDCCCCCCRSCCCCCCCFMAMLLLLLTL